MSDSAEKSSRHGVMEEGVWGPVGLRMEHICWTLAPFPTMDTQALVQDSVWVAQLEAKQEELGFDPL